MSTRYVGCREVSLGFFSVILHLASTPRRIISGTMAAGE